MDNHGYQNEEEEHLIHTQDERGTIRANKSNDGLMIVERKPWRSFMMITTMFTIISSLRMVYSTIASFLPHYISLKQETITSSKTGFILA